MTTEQAMMESLLRSIPEPVFTVDADLTITFFNDAASKITGVAADEAMGQPCHDVFKSNRCGDACMLKAAMAEKKVLQAEEVILEGADGREIPCLVSVAPIFTADGEFAGGIEIIRDITHEQEWRRELEDQRARVDEYHTSSMELAMGLSECFQVLADAREGNLFARVGEETLASTDELIANLAKSLNDTIDEVQHQMEIIQRQQFAIQELSTPILQLWDNVVALPVIGVVDTKRSADIMERLLSEIVARQSKFVILDITGVEVVDTKTADHFVKMIRASQLLGARCVLTGIRPAVAQTLVDIGMDLTAIATMANLQEGLKECLRQMDAMRDTRKNPVR